MSELGEEQEQEEVDNPTSRPVAVIGAGIGAFGGGIHTRHVIAALTLAAAIIPTGPRVVESISNYNNDIAQYRGSKSSTNKATKKAAKKARQRNRGK